jgi:hypothetical protein
VHFSLASKVVELLAVVIFVDKNYKAYPAPLAATWWQKMAAEMS